MEPQLENVVLKLTTKTTFVTVFPERKKKVFENIEKIKFQLRRTKIQTQKKFHISVVSLACPVGAMGAYSIHNNLNS